MTTADQSADRTRRPERNRIFVFFFFFFFFQSVCIEKSSCLRVQCKTMPYVSSNLGCAQLDGSCVWDGASVTPQLECLLVVAPAFMARTPERWRLVMLELNCDIYYASMKLVVGSVSAPKMKTEETAQVWRTTLEVSEN